MIDLCRWFFLGLVETFTIFPRYFYIGLVCLVNPKKGEILKYKGRPVIPITMLGLTLSVYLICIFFTTRWYVQRLKINYLATDIIESTKIIEKQEDKIIIDKKIEDTSDTTYTPPEENNYVNISYMSTDLNELVKKNSDTVGWIKVNNTNINYVVVEGSDNEYYLKHDFYKNNNTNGWVYADYRSNFSNFGNNTIIYGHNLTNRSMFGSLVWTLRQSWYTNEDNWYIKLSTLNTNTVWKIFSIYQIKPEVFY